MDVVMREKSYSVFEKLLEPTGKSPRAVAVELGFTPSIFSDWKRNKSAPNAEKLIKIAEYFDVPITTFFTG